MSLKRKQLAGQPFLFTEREELISGFKWSLPKHANAGTP
jgi:hypothetical protein